MVRLVANIGNLSFIIKKSLTFVGTNKKSDEKRIESRFDFDGVEA